MPALPLVPAAIPLLRAPASWPTAVVGAVAMVLLAALDLAGAVAAKEWSRTSGGGPLVGGLVAYVALFWVYASALQYAELALVTLGWIVVLQLGLLAVDRLRYGIHLPPGAWVAVVVILAAQAYLLLAVGGPDAPPARAPGTTSAGSSSTGQAA